MNVKDKQKKNTIFIQKENQSHNRNNKIAAAKKHHKSHFGRVKSESEIRLDHRQEIEHQSQWTKRKLCVCVCVILFKCNTTIVYFPFYLRLDLMIFHFSVLSVFILFFDITTYKHTQIHKRITHISRS